MEFKRFSPPSEPWQRCLLISKGYIVTESMQHLVKGLALGHWH